MKKTIIALMALAGVAAGSDISLESKLVSGENTYGVYSQWESIKGNTALIEQSKTKYPSSLTFYVKVSDLFGAENLTDTERYQITSFSYLGQASGNCSNGGDILTITLGNQSVSGTVQQSSNVYTSVVFDAPNASTLSFTSSDILTLTLTGGRDGGANDGLVEMLYYDTPGTNQALGAASALNSTGTDLNYYHKYSNHNGNGWDTTVKTDAPVVSMTVRAVAAPAVPEPTTATLSLLALAGLAARRRRK